MMIWTQLDAVYKEIDVMKQVRHRNCIQLYEVIEDSYEQDDDEEEERSEKLYMVMELAKYKEIMSWDENTYQFVPNPQLVRNSISGKSTDNPVKSSNGPVKNSKSN